MRIYTEVNFEWDDKKGKLVEVSSKSFNYSGEMALAASAEFDYYDLPGNRWTIEVKYGWGIHTNEASAERYKLNGNPVDGGWKSNLKDDNKVSYRKELFIKYIKNHAIDRNVYTDYEASRLAWKDIFHEERPDSPADILLNYEKYTGGDYAYVAGQWRDIEGLEDDPRYFESYGNWYFFPDPADLAEFDDHMGAVEGDDNYLASLDVNNDGVIDAEDRMTLYDPDSYVSGSIGDKGGGGDVVYDDQGNIVKLEDFSKDIAKASAESAIEDYIENWKAIVDPDIEDAAQILAQSFVTDLEEKEEKVRTAYDDIFGTDGSIDVIKEGYWTDVGRAEEKYQTDIGDIVAERDISLGEYKTTKEEALETSVIGREGELEALRTEAGETIRAAEAKVGAAGFASTGVGQTARDILAKEIGKEARGIGEGFTRERTKAKEGYLEDVQALATRHESAAKGIHDVYGEGGTIYEDYITARDSAARAALAPWETASSAYKWAKERHETQEMPTARVAHREALGDLSFLMSQAIQGVTEPLPGSPVALDEFWDPFQESLRLGGYDREQFGLSPDFVSSGAPESGAYDIFAEPFYTPYEGSEGLQLYDPEADTGELFDWGQQPTSTPLDTASDWLSETGANIWEGASDILEDASDWFGWSDVNVKKDITRISKLKNGIPVYLFRYKWGNKMNIGVMAQDVEKIIPDAVVEINGIKAVNYSMLNIKE
jgi:hypothetical protein